jgi:hypothetical protein
VVDLHRAILVATARGSLEAEPTVGEQTGGVAGDDVFEVADAVAHAHAGWPGLRMVLVTGSGARGLADGASDLDLVLAWNTVDRQRLSAEGRLDGLGADRLFALPTDHGYFEKYRLDGRYIDIDSVTDDVFERHAEALHSGAPLSDEVAKVAAGLRDARPVVGAEELRAWQARFVYSAALARAEVGVRGSRLLSPSALYELTITRGDVLSFAARLSRVLLDAIALLAAANREFIPVDEPKWMPWHLGRLRHVPPDVVERIGRAMGAPSPVTVADADELLVEVLDLVDERVPGADTRLARFAIGLRPRP